MRLFTKKFLTFATLQLNTEENYANFRVKLLRHETSSNI